MMKRVATLSTLAAAMALLPVQQNQAAGFGISAKSVSAMGNGFAGTTVEVEDASVAYNNPAGMTRLDGAHLSLGLHTVHPDVEFSDDGSNIGGFPLGGDSDSAGEVKTIPNLYYVRPLNDEVRFGLAIYSPFGLGLDYGEEWTGRYVSTKSELKTVNISPSLAFEATERLSLGIGLDLQYVDATLDKQVDFGAWTGGLPGSADGTQSLTGDNWATGFTFGLLYELNEATRLGLAFHSAIRHDIKGKSTFSNVSSAPIAGTGTPLDGIPANLFFTSSDGDVSLHLPEQLSLGIAHDYSDRFTVMGDLTWTRWSRYDTLTVELDNSLGTVTEEKRWNDVWRASVGANYRLGPTWLLRAGYAYDASPVPSGTRDPRVPDNDRHWYTLGTGYRASETVTVDAAYARLVMNDAGSSLTDSLGHTLEGEYSVNTHYISLQANVAF